jgi:aspartokinase
MLDAACLCPLAMVTSGQTTTLLLSRDVADAVDHSVERLLVRLRTALGDALLDERHGTLVSIVGPAIGREPGLLLGFRMTVADAIGRAPTTVLAHGLALSCLLEPDEAQAAVAGLHRDFVQEGPWHPRAVA